MVQPRKVYNFSPGPCVLPEEVLDTAQRELKNWHGTGLSPMEMSHRGKEFVHISESAKNDLRELLHIPKEYKIFFFQGGATLMQSVIPMNLLRGKKTANYMTTGLWSKLAWNEAIRECEPHEVFPGSKGQFNRIPSAAEMSVDPNGAYFHFCMNETVHGVAATHLAWEKVPKGMPVVCDMSSCIGSFPIDWSKFDVIYAGAQKNLGPAGMTVLIIKEGLVGHERKGTPVMCSIAAQDKAPDTYHNTPATWPIYVSGLNFAFMKREGIELIHARNLRKAKMLFDLIDGSNGYFESPVKPSDRSIMNVPFRVAKNKDLENKFAKEAEAAGLYYLKGHPVVGGIRASIYNAMPDEGVITLLNFMRDFQKNNPVAAGARL